MSTEHSILAEAGARGFPWLAAARAGAVLLAGLLLSTGMVLLVRRLAGALEQPLPTGALAAVALLATIAAIVAQRQSPALPTGRVGDELSWWLPAAALVPIALALSLPGTSWAGLFILWLVPAAAETALGYRRFVGRAAVRRKRPAPIIAATLVRDSEPSIAEEAANFEPAADPNVMQQFTRRRTAEGDDLIEGWLRARLGPGQRTTHAHISFCPPFATNPHLEFEQSDGQPARVKLGQVLPYGARFEVKLDAAGPAEVLIAFSARSRLSAADRCGLDSAAD